MPANTSNMPLRIIIAPTICAVNNATNPTWIAILRLMGTAGLARNATMVNVTMIATIAKPPAARLRATSASKVVSIL